MKDLKTDIHKSVQNYYGSELEKSSDLKTNACCTIKVYPDDIRDAMSAIHEEVLAKYYGCGLTIPTSLKGQKVLDLGSGSGRDCYLASKLVGEDGEVVGIDMTDEQLQVANDHIDYHAKKFGYKKSNVRFIKGFLEELDSLDLEDNYFDIIISNCVINLVKDKQKVLDAAFKKLKPGGEMYFSDVYVNRRIPADLVDDPVLYGECLSGSLYWNDFITMAKKAGFNDPRSVERAEITIANDDIKQKISGYEFLSITYRLFKIPELEDNCEDYGQEVVYLGSSNEEQESFLLDDHHTFNKGETKSVCGNTYRMLEQSRFKDSFKFSGSFKTHLGIFEECLGASPKNEVKPNPSSSCC